jgi:hypothetical protein
LAPRGAGDVAHALEQARQRRLTPPADLPAAMQIQRQRAFRGTTGAGTSRTRLSTDVAANQCHVSGREKPRWISCFLGE